MSARSPATSIQSIEYDVAFVEPTKLQLHATTSCTDRSAPGIAGDVLMSVKEATAFEIEVLF